MDQELGVKTSLGADLIVMAELMDLKNEELDEHLKSEGLEVTGKKTVKVLRLMEHRSARVGVLEPNIASQGQGFADEANEKRCYRDVPTGSCALNFALKR